MFKRLVQALLYLVWRKFAAGLLSVFALISVAQAQTSISKDQEFSGLELITIGAMANTLAPVKTPDEFTIVPLETLPVVAKASVELLNAQLAHKSVTSRQQAGSTRQFVFLGAMALKMGPQTVRVSLGDPQSTIRLSAYFERVRAVARATGQAGAKIGFIRVNDPEQLFERAAFIVERQLDQLGLDLVVVSLHHDQQCEVPIWPSAFNAVLNGVADSADFGNQDGATSIKEAQNYLSRALARDTHRANACAPKASLMVLKGESADKILLSHKATTMHEDVAQQLFDERFEAQLLTADASTASALNNYLDNCVFCPQEAMFRTRLLELEKRAKLKARERALFDRIVSDEDTTRLLAFVKSCVDCSQRDAAQKRIDEINWRIEQTKMEAANYAELAANRDLDGLKSFLGDCTLCMQKDDANALITELETERAMAAEQKQFEAALGSRQIAALETYLKDCVFCDAKIAAETALDEEIKKRDLIAPCYQAAGLMQHGGPHRLKDMDAEQAHALCSKAAEAFPERAEFDALLGRVAHARGEREEAVKFYKKAMADDIGFGFGLAAFWAYAPGDTQNADLALVHQWAQKGAAHNDWLSKEILALIYAKGLIKDKGIEDTLQLVRSMKVENPVAQFYLGYFHLIGTGVTQDTDIAKQWLEKAVAQNYVHAGIYLADILEDEAGQYFDPQRAATLYWAALEDQNEVAYARLVTGLEQRPKPIIEFVQAQLAQQGIKDIEVNGKVNKPMLAALEAIVREEEL